jgi:hypothetical protein
MDVLSVVSIKLLLFLLNSFQILIRKEINNKKKEQQQKKTKENTKILMN